MKKYRLIIIGGGPAGLSAALGAYSRGIEGILLVDRNPTLGGLLCQCVHTGFGMQKFGEDLSGLEYAKRLISLVDKTSIEIMTDTSTIGISEDKIITLAGKNGLIEMETDALILASGCRERTIGSLPVVGTRPSGIFTAGSVQKMINIGGYSVGERIVILGSGDIGLIIARRLTLEGKKVLAVVEKESSCGGLMRNKKQCLDAFGIPLLTSSTVTKLYGRERLSGVRVCPVDENGYVIDEEGYDLECDTLVTSLGLIPELDLLWGLDTGMESGKVFLKDSHQTKLPWLFICGNAREIRHFADDIASDGTAAGESAAGYLLL
jgi:Thioredoxin reductase